MITLAGDGPRQRFLFQHQFWKLSSGYQQIHSTNLLPVFSHTFKICIPDSMGSFVRQHEEEKIQGVTMDGYRHRTNVQAIYRLKNNRLKASWLSSPTILAHLAQGGGQGWGAVPNVIWSSPLRTMWRWIKRLGGVKQENAQDAQENLKMPVKYGRYLKPNDHTAPQQKSCVRCRKSNECGKWSSLCLYNTGFHI